MSDISAKIVSIEAEDSAQPSKAAPSTPIGERPAAPAYMAAPAAPIAAQVETGALTALVWISALLWLICVLAAAYFTLGIPSPLSSVSALQWAALAALIIFPMALLFTLGSLAKRFAAISHNSAALLQAADTLTRPDEAAKQRAAGLAGAIRSQIISVDADLKTALDRLAGMETVLVGHTDALASSHIAATRQTGEISKRLSEEREALKEITTNFDERMGALSRLLSDHSDRLAQATHIAETKIQEARVSVEGAAAKINASSEIVRENALSATTTLEQSHNQISDLGSKIETQSSVLDAINSRHAQELSDLVKRLEEEQSRMTEAIAQRLSSMRDMSLSAKLSADTLNEASDAGRQTIEALAESAALADNAVKKRFSEMEDMVKFSNDSAESLTDRAAKRVRDSLSLTRLEISRIEDDMRALEERLTTNSLDFERRETAVDVTPPKSNWRKSLLRFRPMDVDAEPAPLRAPEPPQSDDFALTPPPEAPAPTPPKEPQADLEIPRQGWTDPAQKKPLGISPLPEAPAPETVMDTAKETAGDASEKIEDSLSLDFDMTQPDPIRAEANISAEETLGASRIDPPELRPRRSKKGWSLRGMFGGGSDDNSTNSPALPAVPARSWDEAQSDVITRLSTIGLAPNAVVEAGCVIEAVNSRVAKGSAAMREVVSLRLPQPISHLNQAMAHDPQLKANCTDFAQRYYQVLAGLEGDREALRAELETQTGRAYILCDAALG